MTGFIDYEPMRPIRFVFFFIEKSDGNFAT